MHCHRNSAIRSIVQSVKICRDHIEVMIETSAFGVAGQANWTQSFPRPERRPFREAKLRIDAASPNRAPDQQLRQLLCDAFEVQGLVLASPQLSLNQMAKGAGRCRKQMAKLLNVSWLSPRIVEAIFDGTQPRAINRTRLLSTQLPIDWEEQEALFGLSN